MSSHEESHIPSEILLHAYAKGIFPMDYDGELLWFCPDPRGVLPIEEFHVPRGLKRALRNTKWEIRVNYAFEEVMRACAKREDTWIDQKILASYIHLHELGFAHSVETWCDNQLVGGLYGVSIGAAFFGESMFHRVTDASKVALYALIQFLRKGKYLLLDTQWTTSHLQQFGGKEIPREEYLNLLELAIARSADFGGRESISFFDIFE